MKISNFGSRATYRKPTVFAAVALLISGIGFLFFFLKQQIEMASWIAYGGFGFLLVGSLCAALSRNELVIDFENKEYSWTTGLWPNVRQIHGSFADFLEVAIIRIRPSYGDEFAQMVKFRVTLLNQAKREMAVLHSGRSLEETRRKAKEWAGRIGVSVTDKT